MIKQSDLIEWQENLKYFVSEHLSELDCFALSLPNSYSNTCCYKEFSFSDGLSYILMLISVEIQGHPVSFSMPKGRLASEPSLLLSLHLNHHSMLAFSQRIQLYIK